MFENKKVKATGIHYSRYIASWGSMYRFSNLFKEWLKEEGATDLEVAEIFEMATTGKFELENSAIEFMRKKCG